MNGRVLIVAGSDSGGGAGIQADIKTVTALGGYAHTAVTALTAQDTLGVQEVMPVPPAFLRRQLSMAFADIGADAVKTGMLADAETVLLVTEMLAAHVADIPAVIDPVMVAKGGATLSDGGAADAIRRRLMPLAALITPNVPEAEALTGQAIHDTDGMHRAALALLSAGARAVLLKGGHLPGSEVTDLLVTAGSIETITAPRIESRHTHGTGCTLASAVATGLAQGMALSTAVRRAHAYVQRAIATAPGYGKGHGPLNHAVTVDPAILERLTNGR